MQQWEYLTVQLRIGEQGNIRAFVKKRPLSNEKSIGEAVSLLDELGEQGWEMTTAISNTVPSPDSVSEYYLFFKRPKASLAHVSSLRSIDSATSLDITFQNTTRETVHVYWIDYQGKEVFYRDLKPLTSCVQQTYRTHPWRIMDDSGRVLKEIVALQDMDVIVIS